MSAIDLISLTVVAVYGAVVLALLLAPRLLRQSPTIMVWLVVVALFPSLPEPRQHRLGPPARPRQALRERYAADFGAAVAPQARQRTRGRRV